MRALKTACITCQTQLKQQTSLPYLSLKSSLLPTRSPSHSPILVLPHLPSSPRAAPSCMRKTRRCVCPGTPGPYRSALFPALCPLDRPPPPDTSSVLVSLEAYADSSPSAGIRAIAESTRACRRQLNHGARTLSFSAAPATLGVCYCAATQSELRA